MRKTKRRSKPQDCQRDAPSRLAPRLHREPDLDTPFYLQPHYLAFVLTHETSARK